MTRGPALITVSYGELFRSLLVLSLILVSIFVLLSLCNRRYG